MTPSPSILSSISVSLAGARANQAVASTVAEGQEEQVQLTPVLPAGTYGVEHIGVPAGRRADIRHRSSEDR